MDHNKHHIDNYFKGNLNDLEITPPEDVWQGVSRKLDDKRRIPIISWWRGLAAGIALLIGLGWLFNAEHINHKKISLQVETKKPKTQVAPLFALSASKISHHQKNIGAKPTGQDKIMGSKNKDALPLHPYSTNSIGTKPVGETSGFSATDQEPKHAPILTHEQNLTVLIPRSCRLEQKPAAVNPFPENRRPTSSVNNNKLLANQPSEKPQIKRWSIQGQLAPLYAYRSVTQTAANVSKSELNNTENGLMAYAAMVKVNYQVNKNIYIQTGIGYSMLGYTNNDVYVYQGGVNALSNTGSSPDFAPNAKSKNYYVINSSTLSVNQFNNEIPNVQLVGASPQTRFSKIIITNSTNQFKKVNGEFVQQMKFIQIPFLIRYRLLQSKVSLHFIGGFETNILVSTKEYVNDGSSQNNIDESPSLHTINLGSTLGVGLNYRLPNRMFLVIEPTFKYFINSITTNGNSVHPFAFGVYTGLNYTF